MLYTLLHSLLSIYDSSLYTLFYPLWFMHYIGHNLYQPLYTHLLLWFMHYIDVTFIRDYQLPSTHPLWVMHYIGHNLYTLTYSYGSCITLM